MSCWVLDRFEEDLAILENSETLEVWECSMASLPAGAVEGSVLVKEADGALRLDSVETEVRETRIKDRFAKLKR